MLPPAGLRVMDSATANALSAAVSAAVAVATDVDARAELGALLKEWEVAQRDSPERLVSILTK